jgi:4-hydroxythreonine-4-phosphate dehydrogenase
MGDPAGVGPELALRVASDHDLTRAYELPVVGDASALGFWADRLSLPMPHAVVDLGTRRAPIDPGRPEAGGASASLRAIEVAARLCMSGDADAMVTAPVSKAAISATGRDFTGHTEFLAELTRADDYVMTFVSPGSRIALATTHTPLSRVPSMLTADLILEKLVVLDAGLRDWFGVEAPRIAVAALNPHAGEDGAFGSEESAVIVPGLDMARSRGVLCFGPFPADALFRRMGAAGEIEPERFDAVLAMYHDQGTIPAKLMASGGGVNVTLGLPIVRTSVDHGTAFDLAGKQGVRTGSMFSAVRLAGEIAERVRRESP